MRQSVGRIVAGSVLVVVSMLSAAASAQEAMPGPQSVIAVGRAAGTSLLAKDEALQDAKRQAVAQACGQFIDAGTKVDNYEVVRDRIMSQALGYITRYNVRREWEEDGVTHCEIIAYIKMTELEHDWRAAFSQLREDEDNPRTMIVITQDNDVTDHIPPKLGGACQTKLERHFLARGVRLIRKDIVEQTRDRDAGLADMKNNLPKLAARAASFNADMLVYGDAESVPQGPINLNGINVYRWKISLNLTVVHTDSGQILASDQYTMSKYYTTNGAVCDEKAFSELANEIADKVLKDVFDAWTKRATSHRTVQVFFENCTYRLFSKSIKPALLTLRGVQQGAEGVKAREFVDDVGTVEIYWAFDIDLLADKLLDLEADGLTFEIVEKSANRLGVRVVSDRP